MEKENLKGVVQINTTQTQGPIVVTALCDDGTIWIKDISIGYWNCINNDK